MGTTVLVLDEAHDLMERARERAYRPGLVVADQDLGNVLLELGRSPEAIDPLERWAGDRPYRRSRAQRPIDLRLCLADTCRCCRDFTVSKLVPPTSTCPRFGDRGAPAVALRW